MMKHLLSGSGPRLCHDLGYKHGQARSQIHATAPFSILDICQILGALDDYDANSLKLLTHNPGAYALLMQNTLRAALLSTGRKTVFLTAPPAYRVNVLYANPNVNFAETITASYRAVWIVESAMGWREWDALRRTRTRELDLGLVCKAVAARKWWLIGLPLAALVLSGVVLGLQPARYSAETQILIGPRPAGLLGLRANLALLDEGAATGQARLIASRDLARRAIKDLGLEDKLDPVTRGTGPGCRALIFLGILRDPARKSPEDRVLEAYQDRLRVSGPGRASIVTISFRSEDPELAANAANRIAELYLEMRADAKHAADLPRNTDARIVSRAIPPPHPLYPKKALLLLSGVAMIVMALGALASIALPRVRLPGLVEEPLEQPRALGQVRVFARFKDTARLSPRLNPSLDPPPAMAEAIGGDDPDNGQAMKKIVARILSVPARGPRGIRIVATSLQATGASCVMLDLARDLAREGRSIVIGLGESSLLTFGSRSAGAPHGDAHQPVAGPALGDLLAGTASFAEVIRRDPASRLHFLPVGRSDELELHEFANVLDALAGIYDFILTIAPPLDQTESAKTLAAKTRFAVLVIPARACGGAVFEAERQLIESGAREVLLIGLPANAPQGLGRDAA